MSENNYLNPVLNRMRELFNKYGPTQIRGQWHLGAPHDLGASGLPAGFLYELESDIGSATSAEDEDRMRIAAVIVYDLKTGVNASEQEMHLQNQIDRDIKGKDQDYNFRHNSLVYVLRKHLHLGNNAAAAKLWIAPDEPMRYVPGQSLDEKREGHIMLTGTLEVVLVSHIPRLYG